MYRIVIKLVVIAALLAVLTPSYAYAKLVLLSPADMITKSQLIVTAKVTKRSEERNKATGEFEIVKVLIGDFESKTIQVVHLRGECDGTPDIPDVGSEVFMLLSKDYGGDYCCAYPNSMGIIKNGRVAHIFQGVNVDRQPYVPVYNCFIEGMNRIESQSAHKFTATTILPTNKGDVTGNPRDFKLIYMEVFIPAVTLILVLYLWRNKSQADQ